MSLPSFSTSERKDAEIPVASATRASERRRARRVARSRAPSVAASVVPSGVVMASDPGCDRCARPVPLDTVSANNTLAVVQDTAEPFVVIGAGATGLSVALHLAAGGAAPLVLD